MNALQKIQAAQIAAAAILASFKEQVDATPDATLARTEELKQMAPEDLIARILELEKPKTESKVKTEDVARSLMESTECASLTWGDIADLITTNGLGEKTSAASISSYASKKKGEWNIVPRERLNFRASDLLAAANQ